MAIWSFFSIFQYKLPHPWPYITYDEDKNRRHFFNIGRMETNNSSKWPSRWALSSCTVKCAPGPLLSYYLPKICDFGKYVGLIRLFVSLSVCLSVCLSVNNFSHRLSQKILQLATWNFHSRLQMGRGRHLLFLGARPPRSSAPEGHFRFWRSSHISETAAPIDLKLAPKDAWRSGQHFI